MPYKLGFTMTLAFRLVPVFLDAAVTVVQAQRCRGFQLRRGESVAARAPLRAGDRAGVHGRAAARRRHGDGPRGARLSVGTRRTTYEHYAFTTTDALVLAIAVGVAGAYVALWYTGVAAVPLR